jgi:molecular chaperone GrpE
MADQEEQVTGPSGWAATERNSAQPPSASGAGGNTEEQSTGPVTGMTEEEAQFEVDMEALLQQRDDALDAARRVQADFENYRKRVLREQTALVERSTEGLVEQLLPVLDSFELAVVNLDGGDVDITKVRKGVDLVFAELLAVLEKAGLERIESRGEAFDPNEHEAVMQDDGDGDPIVGDVLRTGWKLKGRVLRPAMVKVVRPSQR